MKTPSYIVAAVLAALVLTLTFAPESALAQSGMSEMEKAFGADEEEAEDDDSGADAEPSAAERAFESAVEEGETESEAKEDQVDEDLPQIGEDDQLAVFELDRGLYFASDLGVFMSFAGTQGYSNIQPYLALHVGYDLSDMFSVQASMAGGYVSNNPISDNELAGGGLGVESYQMLNIGAEFVAALRVAQRFAIEPKLGGGIAHVTPSLTDPNDNSAALPTINPQLTFGVDLNYLTLLTNFTAGASFTGYYVIGPNIPAVGAALHVRYTL